MLFGIRVPKTGSTSLVHLCQRVGVTMARKHLVPTEHRQLEMDRDWSETRMFAGIRHPVPWMWSLYNMICRWQQDPDRRVGQDRHYWWAYNFVPRLWKYWKEGKNQDFTGFLQHLYNHDDGGMRHLWGYTMMNFTENTDYIIRCENLITDFENMLVDAGHEYELARLDNFPVMNRTMLTHGRLLQRHADLIWEHEKDIAEVAGYMPYVVGKENVVLT